MHIKFRLISLAAIMLSVCTTVKAADDPVVVSINDTPFTASQLEVFALGVPPQLRQDRQALLDEFIKRELYYAEAIKIKLEEQSDIGAQLENQRRNFLAGAAISNHFQTHPVTDEQLQAIYQQEVVATASKEYKVRHIMLESGHAADMALAKLKEGTDFQQVATTLSVDASAAQGGNLGWLSLDSMPIAFAEVVPTISDGQYHPHTVQSEFGWHIVMVDETRGVEPPALAQMEQQLRAKLQSQKLMDYMESLKDQAKIDFPAHAHAPSGEHRSHGHAH